MTTTSGRLRRGSVALMTAAALTASGLAISSATSASPRATGTSSATSADDSKITASLQRKFERSDGGPQDFWVSFDGTADTSGAREIDDWDRRGAHVIDRLRAMADDAQAESVALLDAAGVDYTAYWITNAIRIESGDHVMARQLAAESEVDRVFAPVRYRQPDPVKEELVSSRMGPNAEGAVEWGVRNIKADEVWRQYGVRGDGITVASIDSGAQYDHPALINTYRGYDAEAGTFDNDYNWFDVSGESPYPTDFHGHGTHTMGTMVGDDGGANQIGVAPGANWIVANGCCPSDQALIDSAQWMLAPTRVDGTDPDPAMRPDIVNNSWGTELPTNDPFMEDILTAWADAGIMGIWANGNSGKLGCESSGSPGSRILNYSAGAYDSTNTIADFSGRGPGQDGQVKPDISAPGVNVRSSHLEGQYAAMSGTSMAAPHLAGAVALLWSADPALIGDLDTTRQLLDDSALDTADEQCGGTADDNNVYGEGRLDALALVQATGQGELGTIAGNVTHDETGDPVRGASIRLTAGDLIRSARTGDDGTYSAGIPAGDYTATVTAFGYQITTVDITVTPGQTTTTEIPVPAAEGYSVTGVVLDARTGRGIPSATVTVAGTRFTGTASESGEFVVEGVPGPKAYTVRIDGGGCTRPAYRTVELSGDLAMAPVELRRRVDSHPTTTGWWGPPYGYTCQVEPSRWIRGDTPIQIPFTYDTTAVRMPFPFTYFGKSYRTLYVGHPGGFANVSFWRRPFNASEYPYDEYHYEYLPFGISAFSGLGFETDESRILSRTSGRAPNRSFTVEFRDFSQHGAADVRYSFEITFHEDGNIVFAYHDIDPDSLSERGASAKVAWDDHSPDGRATFRTRLEYSDDSPVLDDKRQIRFTLPSNGFVSGKVVDKRTGNPVRGANVDLYDRHGNQIMHSLTGKRGGYRFQLMTGRPYAIAVSKRPGFAVPSRTPMRLTRDRQEVTLRTELSGGRLEASKAVTVERGRTATLRVKNTGTRRLHWRSSTYLPQPGQPQPGTELSSTRVNWFSTVVEEVNGQYWIGDVTGDSVVQVTSAGTPTGAAIDLAAVATAMGVPSDSRLTPTDLAWIESRGWLCMTFYRVVEDIACVEPDTGALRSVIETGFSPNQIVQGLAYDEGGDRFFAIAGHADGGYQHRLHTVAGVDHPDPGKALRSCTYARQGQGLAWNPTSRTLWTHTTMGRTSGLGRDTSFFRQLDPASCAEESKVGVHRYSSGGGPGTSLDLDAQGNLVTMLPFGFSIAEVKTGDPISQRLRWFTMSATSGSLKVGKSQKVRIRVDWAKVPKSVTKVELVLRGNGGARPKVTIPVTLRR